MANKQQDKKTMANELETLTGGKFEIQIGHKTHYIKEPTLAILDEMSKVWVSLPTVEISEKSDVNALISKAKVIVIEQAKNIAKSVAIGLLGEAYFKPFGKLRARRLAGWVYRNITAKELREVVTLLQGAGGLVDFIISIRLASTAVTTQAKNRIE